MSNNIFDPRTGYPIFWEHETNGKVKTLPPLEILNFLFVYDSSTKSERLSESRATGVLSRRVSTSTDALKDTEAGTTTSLGYRTVYIQDSNGVGKKHLVHRIVYKMETGEEPLRSIDPIDGNPLNNKYDNLRLATSAVNNRNQKMHSHNTSGHTGVSWSKLAGKWQAHVKVENKLYGLGLFDTIEEAIAARKGAIKAMNIFLGEDGYTKSHGLRMVQP